MVVNRDGGFILGVLEAGGPAEGDSVGGAGVVGTTSDVDVRMSEGENDEVVVADIN